MSTGGHVYAVEWTAWEQTHWVDGEEQPRAHVRVPRPRRQPVQSALTADYATVEAVEPQMSLDGPPEVVRSGHLSIFVEHLVNESRSSEG